jgi:hypothetical protein
MKSKNVSVCVRTVIERRNEILQRVAGIVRQLRKQSLRLGFCEWSHDVVKL